MRSTSGQSAAPVRTRHRREATQQMLRIGATLGLPEALRSLGADPKEVLAEVGVSLDLFDNPDNRIPYATRGRLMAHCASRMQCPHFGILVGQQVSLPALGLPGLLAQYSTDVGSALHSLVRYVHLHVKGANLFLAEDSGLATLGYQVYAGQVQGNEQVGDGAVAALFKVLRDLCGRDWKPVEAQFAHREPEEVASFRRFFRVPLRFDTEQYAVVFSTAWLDHRLPDSSPELLQLLQQQIDQLEVREGNTFPDQLRNLLRTTIVTGHSSADQVAELFAIHRRTLSRYLRREGTSFREVVDEIRFEIARQLLEDSAMEVVDIALLLGYSNSSAFTRAFRRWSSTTPAAWRASRSDAQPAIF